MTRCRQIDCTAAGRLHGVADGKVVIIAGNRDGDAATRRGVGHGAAAAESQRLIVGNADIIRRCVRRRQCPGARRQLRRAADAGRGIDVHAARRKIRGAATAVDRPRRRQRQIARGRQSIAAARDARARQSKIAGADIDGAGSGSRDRACGDRCSGVFADDNAVDVGADIGDFGLIQIEPRRTADADSRGDSIRQQVDIACTASRIRNDAGVIGNVDAVGAQRDITGHRRTADTIGEAAARTAGAARVDAAAARPGNAGDADATRTGRLDGPAESGRRLRIKGNTIIRTGIPAAGSGDAEQPRSRRGTRPHNQHAVAGAAAGSGCAGNGQITGGRLSIAAGVEQPDADILADRSVADPGNRKIACAAGLRKTIVPLVTAKIDADPGCAVARPV